MMLGRLERNLTAGETILVKLGETTSRWNEISSKLASFPMTTPEQPANSAADLKIQYSGLIQSMATMRSEIEKLAAYMQPLDLATDEAFRQATTTTHITAALMKVI